MLRCCHRLIGDRKKINETDLLLRCDFAHGVGVKPKVRVVDGGTDAFGVFIGDRREQHEPRAVFAVERLGLDRRDVAVEVVPKLGQAVWSGERLVETVRREDNVGLHENEVLVGVGEVCGARLHAKRIR